jgi:hypothetical protein
MRLSKHKGHPMSFLQKTTQTFDDEFSKMAQKSLDSRLQKAGIDPKALNSIEYEELLESEINILKSDTKKVGSGILIGIALSLITGF